MVVREVGEREWVSGGVLCEQRGLGLAVLGAQSSEFRGLMVAHEAGVSTFEFERFSLGRLRPWCRTWGFIKSGPSALLHDLPHPLRTTTTADSGSAV